MYRDFLVSVTWLFLDETLHKTKSVSEDVANIGRSSPSNEDSGIGLNPASQSVDDSDTEMIDLTTAAAADSKQLETTAIVDSDIDTESDFESVTSDTELLIQTNTNLQGEPTKLHRKKLQSILSSLNPLPLFITIKNRFSDCFRTLVICFTCIASCELCSKLKAGGWRCTPQGLRSGAATRLKQLGQTARLLADRRIFLSVSLYGLTSFIFIMQNEVRFP